MSGTTTFGAVPQDLADRWRPLAVDESTLAAILLEDADLKLTVRRPHLAADILAGLVDERLAVMVLVDAVLRVMTNPDSYKSASIGGDGSVSASYFGSEVLRPRVFITNDDMAEIDRASEPDPAGYKPIRSRVLLNGDYY